MFRPLSIFIGTRYTRAKRRNRFVSFISMTSMIGLALGVLHGIGRFLRIYLLKKGFLDGKAGFINAVHGAFYAFLKYVRVDEGNWGFPYNHR